MAASNRKVVFLHIALFCITAYFFLSLEILALADYPNHMARLFIEANYDRLPYLQKYYEVAPKIAPYLGMDLFFKLALQFFDIYFTAKIFVAFAIFILITGMLVLNYTIHKKLTPYSLLTYFFIFNLPLALGFVNFYFSIGFILAGLASYIHIKDRTKLLIFIVPFSLFLFFIHAFGWLIFIVVIAAYELATTRNFIKSAIYGFTIVLIPILLVLFVIEPHEIGTDKITDFGELLRKVLAIPSASLFSNISSGVLTSVFFITLFLTKTFQIKLLQKTIFILIIIAIFTPVMLYGVALADIRLPLIIALIAIASINNFDKKGAVILATFIIIGSTNFFISATNLQQCSKMAEEFKVTIKQIPKGGKLLGVLEENNSKCANDYAFNHLFSLAIIENQNFIPSLFTGIPPIIVKEPYKSISAPITDNLSSSQINSSQSEIDKLKQRYKESGFNPKLIYWQNWQNNFDYVIWLDYGNKDYIKPSVLQKIDEASFFTTYKITK